MINFHPPHQTLALFAEGSLPATEALIVSAHCDMCQQCQNIVQFHTDSTADEIFAEDAEQMLEFGDMMNAITATEKVVGLTKTASSRGIELDGKQFMLPKTLNRFADKMGNWSHLVGKIWTAPVDIGGDYKANFIFMEPGSSVPEHTHKGTETTLVINGEFGDGISMYDSGDFIQMNSRHTHTPSTAADEGCLVFSVVDKPLHFTSGWARLINPFSHLFFK